MNKNAYIPAQGNVLLCHGSEITVLLFFKSNCTSNLHVWFMGSTVYGYCLWWLSYGMISIYSRKCYLSKSLYTLPKMLKDAISEDDTYMEINISGLHQLKIYIKANFSCDIKRNIDMEGILWLSHPWISSEVHLSLFFFCLSVYCLL